jgi:dienelactone hydrolase
MEFNIKRGGYMQKFFILLLVWCFSLSGFAAIKTEKITYNAGVDKMVGLIAYDDAQTTPRPGILVVHDWMGLGTFTEEKAKQLAAQGYVAFAVDIYGEGIRPKNTQEAGEMATHYKNNRSLLRAHIGAAFDKFSTLKNVDAHHIVVMGYCFGGTAALELARSGAPLVGTATFHGGLSNPTPRDAKNIKGKVLVMHGADDPFVPPLEVTAFKKEMNDAHVDMQFIAYPGAVHAFAIPSAGNDNSKGAAYNAQADKKSWQAFEDFLRDVAPITQ